METFASTHFYQGPVESLWMTFSKNALHVLRNTSQTFLVFLPASLLYKLVAFAKFVTAQSHIIAQSYLVWLQLHVRLSLLKRYF